ILGVRCRAARPYPGGSESRNRLSGTPTWPVLLFGAPAAARVVWISRPGTLTGQRGSRNVPAPRIVSRRGSDPARRRRVHQVPRIPGTTTVRNRAAAAPCERDAGALGHPRRGRNRGLVQLHWRRSHRGHPRHEATVPAPTRVTEGART